MAPAPALAQAAQATTQTAVTQDEIVLQGDTTPRPATPTFYGDTGLWFVPTAETMPGGRFSFSVFRANFDRRQGLTDVNQIGFTAAVGLGDRAELFGSWRTVRLDRDVRPVFIASESEFGGVSQEYPYLRRGWSKTLGGPVIIGGKYSLISQSRGDAMSLAPRIMVKFPSGSTWASTNDWDYHLDLVGSREMGNGVELSGIAGAVIRGDSDEFRVSDGVTWGLGAQFPSRSPLRAVIEWQGEFVIEKNTQVVNPPFVAEDGSIAPIFSPISDPTNFKIGAVWNAGAGMFLHGGLNYSFGTVRTDSGWPRHRSQRVGLRRSSRLAPGCDAAARTRARHQGDHDDHHPRATAAAGASAAAAESQPDVQRRSDMRSGRRGTGGRYEVLGNGHRS